MNNDKPKQRSFITQFKIDGRKSWGKYLEDQLEYAVGKKNNKKYVKYLQDQIAYNNQVLEKLTTEE